MLMWGLVHSASELRKRKGVVLHRPVDGIIHDNNTSIGIMLLGPLRALVVHPRPIGKMKVIVCVATVFGAQTTEDMFGFCRDAFQLWLAMEPV